MAPHSSTLAWKIPWTEEPGRLQYIGSLRVGHDWATSLSLFTFLHWKRKWQPTPVFLPGESQGRGSWWAAVYGVAQSWTRLKWLSSSSSCTWMSEPRALIGVYFKQSPAIDSIGWQVRNTFVPTGTLCILFSNIKRFQLMAFFKLNLAKFLRTSLPLVR